MTESIKYFYEIEQRSEEWLQIRRGIITASNISKILTPKKKQLVASTGFLYDFCRQAVDDMPYGGFSTFHTERGFIEEEMALKIYKQKQPEIKSCGFVLNTRHSIKLGCSPDALVGSDGGAQIKSFKPDLQFANLVEDRIKDEHLLQVQFELLVTARKWWDVIYHSSGTYQMVTRIYPDKELHEIMIRNCKLFYEKVDTTIKQFRENVSDAKRFTPTDYIPGLYDKLDDIDL